jgi:two-component system phosphate regulon sensor histidine kinase PhoR
MMRRTRLLWNLLPPLVMILILTLVMITGFTGRSMRGFIMDRTTHDLENTCRLLEPQLAPLVAAGDEAAVQSVCRQVFTSTGTRVTVILPGGRVIGDGEQDPAIMDSHAGRPEITMALAGSTGTSLRYSSTLKHQRLYVATPAAAGTGQDARAFVIRSSLSMQSLGLLLRKIYGEIALVGILLLAVASGVSLLVARGLSRKLGYLRDGAEQFAAGDLDRELLVTDPVEMSDLAHSMNQMARQLDERIRTTESQRQELAAVLASMVEGVIAVDSEETVIRMNSTAARLLGRTEENSIGRSVQEVGHNSDLTILAQQTLRDHQSRSKDIYLGGPRETLLEVQASGLIGPGGKQIGALLVFNDVTRIRRLQTMRRDFVANVSHELKTPITSIKGFVETLIESPPESREELDRFLGIINRQADRLGQIIGDLLALSRLERNDESGEIEFFDLPLRPILERVVRDFQSRSGDEAGRIHLECAESFRARVNAPLLEQAVGNLIDNALKYGNPGTPVVVQCGGGNGTVNIEVSDQSAGIGAQHLPRVFERFYRVDKARSRQMGGTGLGLAIVKHIAQAHGGHASVVSEPGSGSTFTITLPREVPA